MIATYNSNNHVHKYQFLIFSYMSLYVTRLNDHYIALCFPFYSPETRKIHEEYVHMKYTRV